MPPYKSLAFLRRHVTYVVKTATINDLRIDQNNHTIGYDSLAARVCLVLQWSGFETREIFGYDNLMWGLRFPGR